MIVRINQFDVPRAESEADWGLRGLSGPIVFQWPTDARAYEVLVLEHDEQRRPLAQAFRHAQLRQLIAETVAALREPGEEIVVRLDGALAEHELLPGLRHLTDPAGVGRFALSPVEKLDPRRQEIIASLRIQPSPQTLLNLCADGDLGLERSVRLRAFAVPEKFVNPLLDVTATDDERWGEILGETGFVLSTARGMRCLHVLTSRFQAHVVKSRIMMRLTTAGARGLGGGEPPGASST